MSQNRTHRSFSPGRVLALAHNTLLELIRLKVFYFLLLFALLIIGGSIFTVQFSFQNPLQVLKDMGLGAMSIFSWLLGLLCTAILLPKDQEDRTLYTILAKPVSRFEYLLGKLGGVYILITLSVLIMSAMFAGVLSVREHQEAHFLTHTTSPELLPSALAALHESAFNTNLIPGILLILLKALLCSALTLLLSTVATSSVFTLLTSVVVYLIGHLQGIAREAWQNAEQGTAALKALSAFIALAFPDLQLFNMVDEIAVGTAVPMALFWQVSGFGVLYIAVYFLLAQVIFASKEL